jgi:hypothetical protein
MAWALVEGLAGVVDTGRTLDAVRLSPRWAAAEVDEADVSVGYAASAVSVRYAYRRERDRVSLDVAGAAGSVALHLLLPPGSAAAAVTVDGAAVPFESVTIEHSGYVDAVVQPAGPGRTQPPGREPRVIHVVVRLEAS